MREIFSLVGRIRTEGIDTLQKGLDGIDKRLTKTVNKIDRFGRNVQKAGVSMTKLTAPLAVAGAGVLALATKTGQAADRLLDLREITGLSTDTLQELKNVTADAGVDFEGFAGTISKLSNQIPEIAKGTGPASEAIKALGINVFDAAGNVRDMDALFPEMLDKLRGVENVTQRNAMAQDLFGRSLDNIAPVLGMTTEQFEAARNEAHEMGLVMSEGALNSANEFRKSLDKLKLQIGAVGMNIGSAFVPILQDVVVPLVQTKIVPALQAFAGKVKQVADWFNGLSPIMKDIVVGLGVFAVTLGPVLIATGKMITMIKTAVTTFKLLSAVMMANPIGLIITAIGLLVTAGIILYRNWDTVKEKFLGVWDGIVYGVQQAISYMKTLIFAWVKMQIDAINTIGKYVPVLNTALDSASVGLKRMMDQEKEARYERKLMREETKLAAAQTEEMAAVVEEAKQTTEQYTQAEVGLVAAKKQDAAATVDLADKEQELLENRVSFEQRWGEKLRGEILNRKQKLEWEYQEALSLADEYGASREDIELYYSIQRMKLAEEERKEEDQIAQAGLAMEKALNDEKTQMALGAIDQVFSLFEQDTDRRLALVDQQTEREKAAIEQSTLSEEEKKAKIAALDEEADKKKKELMLKQAKRDKAAAIFAAVVNTFQAVAKALTLGVPGIILAAVLGALGAVQIGLIAAQPLPQLAEGGLIKQRPGGVQAVIGEGNQDELVLPMRTGAKEIATRILDGLMGAVGAVLPPTLPAALGGGGASPAFAGAGSDGGMHLHIHGNFFATDSSYRQLERDLLKFRKQEAQRKGEA